MTWGKQNTEAEAHEQMAYAFDQGVNFLDTAEVTPLHQPPMPIPSAPSSKPVTWREHLSRILADHGMHVSNILKKMICLQMYPVPPAADVQGLTDKYIGSWMKGVQRDKVILATKVACIPFAHINCKILHRFPIP